MEGFLNFLTTPTAFYITAVFLILLFIILAVAKKKEHHFEFLTHEDVTDDMRMQSVYLTKRIHRVGQLKPEKRAEELKRIRRDINHFLNTFCRMPGFYHEWNDMMQYYREQKKSLSNTN